MAKPDSWKGASGAGHLAPPTLDCFTHHVDTTEPASWFLQGSQETLVVRVYGRASRYGQSTEGRRQVGGSGSPTPVTQTHRQAPRDPWGPALVHRDLQRQCLTMPLPAPPGHVSPAGSPYSLPSASFFSSFCISLPVLPPAPWRSCPNLSP